MNEIVWEVKDVSGTQQLGAVLAEVLPDTTTIGLNGTLGAGKTRLVQAVAQACGVAGETVTSPTFVLCHEYHAARTIYHMDAYRIADEDEFLALGPEEYFQSPGLTFVEWANRVEVCLPEERLEIAIDILPDQGRRFAMVATGGLLEVLPAIRERLGIAS